MSLISCSASPPSALVLDPAQVEMGWVGTIRPASTRIDISNPRSDAVSITRFETSCDCVTIAPRRISIPARGHEAFTVNFDPRVDPEFRGPLSVEVIGTDGTGARAFATRVRLEVR